MRTIERHLLRVAAVVAVLAFGAGASFAHHIQVSFAEVAQTADLVFVGTVASQSSRLNERGTMAFTDVTFADVEVVNATGRSKQKAASTITLTFPGGTVGDITYSLCDTTRFETGGRYVLFALDDGQLYTNPLVGGPQGLFNVVRDGQTGEEFVATAGRHAVVEMRGAELVSTEARVAAIEGGSLVLDASADANKADVELPVSTDGRVTRRPTAQMADAKARPLSLRGFVDQIRNVALRTTLPERAIQRFERGPFPQAEYARSGAETVMRPAPHVHAGVAKASGPAIPQIPRAGTVPAPSTVPPAPADSDKVNGGALGACGAHAGAIAMEQYPADWVEFGVANRCMFMWNQSRDVFRFNQADGTWDFGNDVNEFVGYPTSADLTSQDLSAWGATTAAVTATRAQRNCGEILESDVALNPALSWTDDPNLAFGNLADILWGPVLMHELGHVWGSQLGAYVETYDYDELTVMHMYRSDTIVENGWGVHAADAVLIRRHYGWAENVADMGVESYYGSNGLENSTISGTKFKPGDLMTINDVVVENMSSFTMQGATIRFYLSTDNVIGTDDVELGFYTWDQGFPRESYDRSGYNVEVPTNLADGVYFVGMMVTINSFVEDDVWWNNATYLTQTITVERPAPIRIEDIKGFQPSPLRPWKLKMFGSDLREGMRVYLGTEGTEWTQTRLKHSGLFVLKGGNALKKMFPIGVEVPIRIVAPDGEEITVSFTR